MAETDAARSLVSQVAARLGDQVLLWRGPELDGRDIDLLAMEGAEGELGEVLAAAGLAPSPQADGQTVWSAAGDGGPIVDVLPSSAWPPYYPPLAGVLERAARSPGLPPLASAEDRLLILGAEVVAGRPIDKALRRARRLLDDPDVAGRLAAVAGAEGMEALAELISRPDRLARLGRRGRLGYPRAAWVALRSRPARAALAARVRARLARLASAAPGPARPDGVVRPAGAGSDRGLLGFIPRRGGKGMLIALSGMDGAGKSTAAAAIRAHLEELNIAATVSWARLGADLGVLDALARWVKRLLRREGTIADPVAAGSQFGSLRQHPAYAQGRRSALSWVWILLVAANTARYLRRAVRARRDGTTVVCDRWLVDSLVDLELRYGRHRIAELVLSKAAPRPELGILLHIDGETAYARKPYDQALRVLQDMERRYTDVARRHDFLIVDARQPPEQVGAELRRAVDAALAAER